MDKVEEKGFIPADLVESEVQWFYSDLGIDDMYFSTETVDVIVSHILSLYAAKVASFARDDKKLDIRLDKEAEDHAVYIDTSIPGVGNKTGPAYEQRIDSKYLDVTNKTSYRVESFRSAGKLPDGQEAQQLRCYFVYQCDFAEASPGQDETRIDLIADKRFLQKATKKTLSIYQEINELAVGRYGPVLEIYDIEGSKDKRLVIAYRQHTCHGFFSSLSDLVYHVLSNTPRMELTTPESITTMASQARANTSVSLTFPLHYLINWANPGNRAILKRHHGHVAVPPRDISWRPAPAN